MGNLAKQHRSWPECPIGARSIVRRSSGEGSWLPWLQTDTARTRSYHSFAVRHSRTREDIDHRRVPCPRETRVDLSETAATLRRCVAPRSATTAGDPTASFDSHTATLA